MKLIMFIKGMVRSTKFLIYISLIVFVSCDTMKKVTSKYNILYNGNLFFDEGLNNLKQDYNENFWEILPVIVDNNLLNLDDEYPTNNFIKSEDKAIKVIQKKGVIENENSNHINQAYLLLGKSRFFDQRYISSIQALNYILKQDKKSEIWYDAFFWRNLIHINLEQVETAIQNLKNELKSSNLNKSEKELIYLCLSEAYSKNNDYKNLIKYLNLYNKFSNDKVQKARSNFIIAQSYVQSDKTDSAAIFFKKVINSKISRFSEIKLDAILKESLFADYNIDDRFYKKLLNQPRNLNSKPKIQFYYALYLQNLNKVDDAKNILTSSLKSDFDDKELTKRIYEKLYYINLGQRNYEFANSYLDTLLGQIDKSSSKFFKLNLNSEKLSEIAALQKENSKIDSIIFTSSLDSISLINYQNSFLEKKPDKAKKPVKIASNNKLTGTYYFENSVAMDRGKLEFDRVWGNIARVDNWRYEDNLNVNTIFYEIENEPKSKQTTEQEVFKKEEIVNVNLDSLDNILSKNYYKIGIYTFEYFDDSKSSEEYFNKPNYDHLSEDQYLQSRFYLYKIYNSGSKKDIIVANRIKDELTKNYKNSIYTKKINEEDLTMLKPNEIDSLKDNIKKKIKSGNFSLNQLKLKIDSILPLLNNRKDQFEMKIFQAESSAILKGIDKYLLDLKKINQNYPEFSDELGLRIKALEKYVKSKSIKINDEEYVCFFILKEEDINFINDIDMKIQQYNSNLKLLVKSSFKTKKEARFYIEEKLKKNKILSNSKYFVISTPQYVNMLTFKTLNDLKI